MKIKDILKKHHYYILKEFDFKPDVYKPQKKVSPVSLKPIKRTDNITIVMGWDGDNKEEIKKLFNKWKNKLNPELWIKTINSNLATFCPKISLFVYDEDRLIGFYLLEPSGRFINLDLYHLCDETRLNEIMTAIDGKSGVVGTALFLLPEYRGKGIYKDMLNMVSKMGYDYIWGGTFKELEAYPHWIKNRDFHCEKENKVISIGFFK